MKSKQNLYTLFLGRRLRELAHDSSWFSKFTGNRAVCLYGNEIKASWNAEPINDRQLKLRREQWEGGGGRAYMLVYILFSQWRFIENVLCAITLDTIVNGASSLGK